MRKAVLLVVLASAVVLAGCAQEARHEYLTSAIQQALLSTDSLQGMASEYSDAAKAKAAQDLERQDNALMLKIKILSKAQYADDKALEAAILEAMQKYKTSVVAVETDLDTLRERDADFADVTDLVREALSGVLAVEAKSWANYAARADLINEAVVGRVVKALSGGAK